MAVNIEIRNAFNAHASEYERASKIQNAIGERMLERLQYIKHKPRYILDLGCGVGRFTGFLKTLYPEAVIVGLDVAYLMLQQAKTHNVVGAVLHAQEESNKGFFLVNGDMQALPFADNVFDLVFANQVVHWGQSIGQVFAELSRVMNIGGCLMFSSLGPDTFIELKQAFAVVDNYAHVNEFMDLHDVGDNLLAARFLDPVMDMEIITAHYASVDKLLKSLQSQGVRNIHSKRRQSLTGKSAWQQFTVALQGLALPSGKIPLTYEVVYGHAWKGAQRQLEDGIETMISVDVLRRVGRV